MLYYRSATLISALCLCLYWPDVSVIEGQEKIEYTVALESPLKYDGSDFLWFHPRAAAIPPRSGSDTSVLMTLQKHLKVSDYYSGLHTMFRSSPGGSWRGPDLPPQLDWKQLENGVTMSVADVTPGYHAATGKVLAIGCRVRYDRAGKQLDDVKQAHQTVYAVYDPTTDQWTSWQQLDLPDLEQFNFARSACAQWITKSDGSLLVPLYVGKSAKDRYSTTVARCAFDGRKLSYIEHGNILRLDEGRGLYEPSLVAWGNRYYLTLRNDVKGYVTRSEDGLTFDEPKPWCFDDATELGSYNTQQHWLAHSDGLLLIYTRRGANNDHIIRHRAPLFMAQIDTQQLQVIRATERVIVPERGAELGNFGACMIDASESWVTVSEGMFMKDSKERGAEGATFVARIRWTKPNRIADGPAAQKAASAQPLRLVTLGDSITKGVRPGVQPDDTFARQIEKRLRAKGISVEVTNVGIGGERTDGALKRLTKDVIALNPSIVTIMYGTNDSYVDQGSTQPRISMDEYRRNLEQLVQLLRENGSQPILMTEPRWGKAAAKNGTGEHPNVRLEQYMTACRAVAREKNVPLVDHFQAWTDAEAAGSDIAAWTTDQCHPNSDGHQKLADRILPAIEAVIGAKSTNNGTR